MKLPELRWEYWGTDNLSRAIVEKETGCTVAIVRPEPPPKKYMSDGDIMKYQQSTNRLASAFAAVAELLDACKLGFKLIHANASKQDADRIQAAIKKAEDTYA